MMNSVTIHGGRVLLDGNLKPRRARPLNGLEIKEAVETHLLTLTDRLLGNIGLLSDQVITLAEQLRETVREVLSRQSRLLKIHLTYPGVGWNVKTRVEQLEDHSYAVNAEVELDLHRNIRLNLQFGESGRGIVIASLEEEKIPTDTPDVDREAFNMPVEAEVVRKDGTTAKVDIRELRGERRAARSIDVGSGAPDREARLVPSDEDGVIGTKEILMTVGDGGQPIVLPSQLPKVTLDDVVATPPPPPQKPAEAPLPPKGVGQFGKPNVKFKAGK